MNNTRVNTLVSYITFGFIFVICGLLYVQIIRYPLYSEMSEGNRLRVTPLMAPRGTIFDRSGNVIAKDVLSFNASIVYSQVKDKPALARIIAEILSIPEEDVKGKIAKARSAPYTSACVAPDIGMEGAIRLEEITYDHPGLTVEFFTKRKYADAYAASQLLGFLGLINRPEFDRLKHYGYRINDLVGREGIENQYDTYLRGTNGGKQLEVDNMGREVSTLGYKEPIKGKDLYLTLDLRLQKFCYDIMKDKRGAVIVMDPNTGALLSLVNVPSYNLSLFQSPKRSLLVQKLLDDEATPMLNRAIAGAYPPGSVFKLVVATAALETKRFDINTTFTCTGSLKLGSKVFHCWKKDGHGEQNIVNAIRNSCNVFFYNTGLRIDVDAIADTARKFGIGSLTGIDIPGEAPGTLPSRKWKRARLGQDWFRGETVNYAIGQGYLLVTPIQIARMVSVFANKGSLVRPHIVEKIENVPINQYDNVKTYISSGTMDIVREGMRRCVNDEGSTGQKAKLKTMLVAGKTGTAQTSRGKNHGWFAGFAPFDNAQLVVVVFDEYGGRGGYYAAALAGQVFQKAADLGIIKVGNVQTKI